MLLQEYKVNTARKIPTIFSAYNNTKTKTRADVRKLETPTWEKLMMHHV